MSSKLSKILTIVILVIAVIGIALFIPVVTANEEDLAGAVGPMVSFSVILLIVSIVVAFGSSIYNSLKNPENLKSIAIGLAILGVLYLVCYLVAGSGAVYDVQGNILEGGEAGSTSKLISAIINYSSALGIIAVGAVVFGAVKNAIK